MPPSTPPVSSPIVLPPITAFDQPSRDAPVYGLNRAPQYHYLPYPPQVPSSASADTRAPYQPGPPIYQPPPRQVWPSQPYSLPQQARAPPQDHNLLLAQPPAERSNFKEVKRRTKTGCQTCRKRRIKVSFSRNRIPSFQTAPALRYACQSCFGETQASSRQTLIGDRRCLVDPLILTFETAQTPIDNALATFQFSLLPHMPTTPCAHILLV